MADFEVGRELSAAELVVKTVVIVSRDDRPHMFTAWVHSFGPDWVGFYSGVGGSLLIVHLREDGTMADDTGRLIRVYEYLGAI